MSDTWLSDHDRVEELASDIMARVTDRNKLTRDSPQYVRVHGQVRSMMRQYSGEVSRLRQALIKATTQYHIGQREADKRQGMLDRLASREQQMEHAFNSTSSYSRPGQVGGGGAASGNPFEDDDSDPLDGMSFNQVRQHQQQAIREQDGGLEALSHVLSRQKKMAVDIGNEVDDQNTLIDDIHDHVDRTDERLIRETRHIEQIDRKSNTCIYWVVILLLMVAIIVIVAVPFK